MRFRGKVDWYIYAAIVIVAVIEIPIMLISLGEDKNYFALCFSLLIFIIAEAFLCSITVRNYVDLDVRSMKIAFGFITKEVYYPDIRKAHNARNLELSLAASIDRIKINCKTEYVFIAVKDKKQFISILRKKGIGFF